MVTRKQIVQEVMTYVGTPFRHQGRLKGRGVDCVGLIIGVAHALQLSAFDAKGYGRSPISEMMMSVLMKELEMVDRPPKPGDVLYMAVPDIPQHLVMVVDNGYVVHSTSLMGKVVHHALPEDWRSKIHGVFQFRGLEDC